MFCFPSSEQKHLVQAYDKKDKGDNYVMIASRVSQFIELTVGISKEKQNRIPSFLHVTKTQPKILLDY